MDIYKFFQQHLQNDIFEYHFKKFLDMESCILCKFPPSTINKEIFEKKYFEMKQKYICAVIPSFIHIGGNILKNGIDITIPIGNGKILVIEISEYHTVCNIQSPNTFEQFYEFIDFNRSKCK